MNTNVPNNRRVNTDFLYDPFFIGFDTVLDKLNSFEKSDKPSNYPPYNLIKTGDNDYVVELALAGFDEKDINVEVENGVLTISANVGDYYEEEKTDYLHKGIAARSFVKKFKLSDTVEVESASLNAGMLTVRLKSIVPEEKKPKKIPINNGEKTFLTE